MLYEGVADVAEAQNGAGEVLGFIHTSPCSSSEVDVIR